MVQISNTNMIYFISVDVRPRIVLIATYEEQLDV